MKKRIAFFIILVITLWALSACNDGSYDEGYADGYDAGYYAAAIRYRNEPSDSGSSKADEILAKYGISQIRGSENTTPTSGGSIADDFIEKWNGGPSSYAPPASGTILSGTEYYGSQITVTADSSSHYVVSLKNSSGVERLSFFVKSGDTVTVGVPSEYLYVYFASGTVWYGYGEGLMFGKETVYSKDDDLLDFTNYTYEYTLYPVYNGNFSETPCDESEFFG